jgi:hypothetical protein
VTQVLCGQQTIVTRRGGRLSVSAAERVATARRVEPRRYGQEKICCTCYLPAEKDDHVGAE